MTDDMLGPSPMHIKYSSYVYGGFAYDGGLCNFPLPLSLSYPSSPVVLSVIFQLFCIILNYQLVVYMAWLFSLTVFHPFKYKQITTLGHVVYSSVI